MILFKKIVLLIFSKNYIFLNNLMLSIMNKINLKNMSFNFHNTSYDVLLNSLIVI